MICGRRLSCALESNTLVGTVIGLRQIYGIFPIKSRQDAGNCEIMTKFVVVRQHDTSLYNH